MEFSNLIQRYFEAEEHGDIDSVVDLCAPDVVIRNAAQPAVFGKEGARRFASDFKERTDRRAFEILAVAENGDVGFAWWDAKLVFKAGIPFGPVTTKRPFTLALQGVCRFKIDGNGRFKELDVFHETTSGLLAAQEASR
jgi:ketosteroid isomerase-like protein